jgi:hypothetical protein
MKFMVYLTVLSLSLDYVVPIGRMIYELKKMRMLPSWDDVLAFATVE